MFTRFPGCLARRDPPQAGRAGGAQAGGIQFPRPQIKEWGPRRATGPVGKQAAAGQFGPGVFPGGAVSHGCLPAFPAAWRGGTRRRRDAPEARRPGEFSSPGRRKRPGPPRGRRPGGETSSPRPVWAWRISGRSGRALFYRTREKAAPRPLPGALLYAQITTRAGRLLLTSGLIEGKRIQ